MQNESIKIDNILKKFETITNKVKFSDYMIPYGKYKGMFLADLLVKNEKYYMWMFTRSDGELRDAMIWHLKERKRK